MPSKAEPLWVLTALVLFGFPVTNFIYWPEVLRSGVLPPDGDSIAIPMVGSVLLMLIVSPVVLGMTWLCVRRYNPETRLFAWRHDRPLRSMLASLVFGSAAAFVAFAASAELRRDWPWYEYVPFTYLALWIPWLLGLRAAVIEQLEYEPTYSDR